MKEQLRIWDKDKAERLLNHWGDYEEATEKPIRIHFNDAVNELVDFVGPTASVLDVGCGLGHDLWPIRNKASRLIGMDFSPAMIEKAKEMEMLPNVEWCLGSCWKIPFTDNTVDIVTQLDVCMHVGGSWNSIKEMIRVARKFVIFSGPSFEMWYDVMDKPIEGKLAWGVSIPLLNKKLGKFITKKRISTYYYRPRPVKHKNFKLGILIVEVADTKSESDTLSVLVDHHREVFGFDDPLPRRKLIPRLFGFGDDLGPAKIVATWAKGDFKATRGITKLLKQVDPKEILEPPLRVKEEIRANGRENFLRSIKKKGVKVPIILIKRPEGFLDKVWKGQRRVAAAQLLELDSIPALVIKEVDDENSVG